MHSTTFDYHIIFVAKVTMSFLASFYLNIYCPSSQPCLVYINIKTIVSTPMQAFKLGQIVIM